jgi:hypothetical protein
VAQFSDEAFMAFDRVVGSAPETLRTVKGTYTTETGIVDSAIYDFQIADNKKLLSISVNLEPLVSGDTVVVKYQLDQDGSWLTAGTISVAGTTTQTFQISTNSSTRTFRNLQIRLELNNGSNASTPIVTRVGIRATVVEALRVWRLMLDCSNETGDGTRNWDGPQLLSAIRTLGDAENIVELVDGYHNELSQTGLITTDVVIDEYEILSDKPGEGIAVVTLREVV